MLSRVTVKSTNPATAAGGNAADVLSALFGEASATGATFPVTLQEAIAGGEVPVEDAAVGGAVDDGGAAVDDDDDTILSLEAALAAAGLDLGTPTSAVPQTAPADAAAEVATGDDAPGTPSAFVDAAPANPTGKPEAANADQTIAAAADGGDALPNDAPPTASADQGRPVPAALVATDAADPASAARPGSLIDAPNTAHASTGERAAHVETKGDQGAPNHQPRDGIAATAVREPFSSGGDGRQALDLGTPEREQAGTAEAIKRAATTVGATVNARAAEALHLPSAATPADRGEGAAPPPPPTGPTHATATVERGTHASTASSAASIEARWGERVADALRLSAGRGGGEIRLQLEPEGLGHIDVRVHLQADGVRAVIVAEHESTRALLQSQQHVLEDALARSDVRLSGFSVDVGSGGGAASFAASSEHERGGRPGDTASPAPTAGVSEPGLETNEAHAGGRLSVRV